MISGGEKKTIAKVHLLSGKQIEHGVNGSKVGSWIRGYGLGQQQKFKARMPNNLKALYIYIHQKIYKT